MKKILALLLAAALLLSLTACKAKQAEQAAEASALADAIPEAEAAAQAEAQTEAETAAEPEPSDAPAEPYVTPEELVGSWTLSGDNDIETLNAVFPGTVELGGMMEIGMDGLLFWTLGLSGGGGNFTVKDDVIKAELVSDHNGSPEPVDIDLDRDGAVLRLVMHYNGTSIIWEPAA